MSVFSVHLCLGRHVCIFLTSVSRLSCLYFTYMLASEVMAVFSELEEPNVRWINGYIQIVTNHGSDGTVIYRVRRAMGQTDEWLFID